MPLLAIHNTFQSIAKGGDSNASVHDSKEEVRRTVPLESTVEDKGGDNCGSPPSIKEHNDE